jgi:uncharacterized protein (TIGR03083 family)
MFDIERIRESWQREAAAIDTIVGTINPATAAEPLRSDGWTTHDLLGHVANAARGFVQFVQGRSVEPFDVDVFNEQQRERGRQRAWEDVQQYWARVRDEVTAFLGTLDSSVGDQPVTLPHLPDVKTAGEALQILVVHTRAHRQELEQGFPPVQA